MSLNGYYAHHGYAAQLPDYVSQQLVTPQFNDLGAQISVPQPGNAVEQLPPFRRRIAGWVSNKGVVCRSDEQIDANLEALA